EQVVDAMEGLTFQAWGRPVRLREDNQGIEAQLVGTTKRGEGYDFMVLDDMMIFDSTKLINPPNQKTGDWLKTLTPELIKLEVPVFKHGG
ncbi:MAG TPA: branched-chain amino acid ABC transporter substrate-binding protein, partial [Beijerinckiaceae bacterium]|nr:branched-chain amino acid ABC transporter substrate-binding protein [Beijerinckiaceae bacterium]